MESMPLRDIHLPNGVPLWPLAPGWWGLLIAFALGLLVLFVYWRRGATQRYCLAQLRSMEARFATDGDKRRLVTDISTLLRRVCLTLRPRETVASLTGKAWRDALVEIGGPRAAMPDKVAWQIVHGPYNPAEPVEPRELIRHTRRWLRALPRRKGGLRTVTRRTAGALA